MQSLYAARLFAVAAGLLLAGFGAAWRLSAPATIDSASLQIDRAYAIEVTGGRASMDLHVGGEYEYLLIVSSFAPAEAVSCVVLSSEAIDAAAPIRATVVEPLTMPSAPEPAVVADVSPTSALQAAVTAETRHFHLHVTDGPTNDPRHYVRVRAQLVARGRRVRVFLDEQTSVAQIAAGLPQAVVAELEQRILPAAEAKLGAVRDVDGDGTLAVLISPWLNRLQGGAVSLGGFVRAGDFRADVEPPFGDKCDVIYLNSSLRPGRHLRTLLAHELAHVVLFSERLPNDANRYGLPDEEDWLNEAIAHLAENLNGAGWSNLDYRVRDYLAAPHTYPLLVPDYAAAGLFRCHGCRGATFLFLRWCIDRYGEGMLRRLIRSPVAGVRNIERAARLRFDELYRRFTIALWRAGSGDVNRPDDFRSLDLTARIGRYRLHGPQPIEWNTAGAPREIELRGSATAFIRIRGAASPGLRRLEVRSAAGAGLQVTLIPLAIDDVGDASP